MLSFDKFKDLKLAEKLSEKILSGADQRTNIMAAGEGLAYSIIKNKLCELVKGKINFLFGPGCPACITPIEVIDKAVSIASLNNAVIALYEEFLCIPGSKQSLNESKEKGNDIRVIDSPLEAVKIAESEFDKKIVFLSAGFEHSTAINSYALSLAHKKGLRNFFILNSQPVFHSCIKAVLSSCNSNIQGLMLSGKIITVTGYNKYHDIAAGLKIPIVVSGCEPLDILHSVYLITRQLDEGRSKVENQFIRGTSINGNNIAVQNINNYFEVTNKTWRSLGLIENSSYKLKKEFSQYDAEKQFSTKYTMPEESVFCEANKVLRGSKAPDNCSAYTKLCTPSHTLGAPMASKEGICNLFFKYRR